MVKLVNRAKMTTSTTGSGTITLGSASDGYQTFAAAGVSNGDTVRYTIEDGNAWEIGQGQYTSSGTLLSRTVSESSNSDNALNLSGNAVVFVTAAASDMQIGTSLTKTFTQNEEATITLANSISPVPTIGVFKEIPQVGVIAKGNWDVNSTGSNYDRFDEAPVSFSGATLTPSSATADGTFTLSSGSFASTDVGKTVEGNSGKAIITATSGAYNLVTAFADTSAIAAGSWALYGTVPKTDGSGLELSNFLNGSGSLVFPSSQYFPAVTNTSGQINSSSWTDINSMTADEAAGNGTVNYAVSTDDRTTWSVAKSTDGVRKIAKNNSGTWQYNNDAGTVVTTTHDIANASYVRSATNLQSIVQTIGSHTSTIAFWGMWMKPDGTAIFVPQYDKYLYKIPLTTAYDISSATATNGQKSNIALTQSSNVGGIAFNADGDRVFVTDWNYSNNGLEYYNLSTDWDLSTMSYGGSLNFTNAYARTPEAITFGDNGKKLFMLTYNWSSPTTYWITQWNLTSGYDLSTISGQTPDSKFQVTSTIASGRPRALSINSTGSELVFEDSNSNPIKLVKLTMTSPYNLSTASVTSNTISGYSTSFGTAMFSTNGEHAYIGSNTNIHQISIGSSTASFSTGETWANATTNSELAALQQALSVAQNRMDKTQLDAIADGNHFPLGSTLDLMIAVQMASGSTAPKSDGVSINYDAAAINRQAVNGTDYEAEFPSSTSVKIKSLAAQNLKVRIL